MIARFEWQPRDLWVGVYWKTGWEGPIHLLHLWICLVPMAPLYLCIAIGDFR